MVVRHTDRPDKDCAFNPGLGKCKVDCTEDQSFCECPHGFVMNEDDQCRPDKKCPKGFEEHTNDETGACFPTAKTLSGGDGSGKKQTYDDNYYSHTATTNNNWI